jgi:hypothetical protein
MTSVFETNGLPFADIPDMQVGSMDSMAGVREIPDPVNPQIAAVLQGAPLANPAPNAAPAADALWVAGQLVAEASRTGRLSGDYVLHWLAASMDREQRVELMRRVMDPAVRFSHLIWGWSRGVKMRAGAGRGGLGLLPRRGRGLCRCAGGGTVGRAARDVGALWNASP